MIEVSRRVPHPHIFRGRTCHLYEFGLTSGCPDLDGDGVVSIADLARLLANFGRNDASSADGDMNGDGSVNLTDLTIFQSDFGATC
jgi:hypothetical protein